MDLRLVLFGDCHVDVLFLLALDLKGLNTHVEDEILLVGKTLLSFRQQNTLDLDNITGKCLFHVGLSKH